MIIAAEQVVTAASPDGPVPFQGFVELTDGVIGSVSAGQPPHRADVTLADGYLLPGLVDLQVNGYFGFEFQKADVAAWTEVAARLPSTGTTSFVPTIITAPVDTLATTLRAARAYVPSLPASGARVLGVHVEGPFIAPTRRGAHNPQWITDPNPVSVAELIEARRARRDQALHGGGRAGQRRAQRRSGRTGRGRGRPGRADGDSPVQRAAGPVAPGARRGRASAHRPPADERAERRPAPRRRVNLRPGVPGCAGPDRAGHGRGGAGGHAAGGVPARRRTGQPARRGRRASRARRRDARRIGAPARHCDPERRGLRRVTDRGGSRRHVDPGRSHRAARSRQAGG